MEENKDHIDSLLFEQLSDAEFDDKGIDWNSFQKKNKKKRAVFFYRIAAGIALLIITGIAISFYQNQEIKPIVVESNSDSDQLKNKHNQDLQKQDASKEINENDVVSTKSNASDSKSKRTYSPAEISSTLNKPVLSTPNNETPLNKAIAKESIEHFSMEQYLQLKEFGPIDVKFVKDELNLAKHQKNIFKRKDSNAIKYYFEAELGAQYNQAFFRISEIGRSFIHKDYEGIRKNSEMGQAGYNFRVSFGRRFKNFDLGLGIGLSKTSISGRYDYTYSEKPIIDKDGKIVSYNSTNPTNIRFDSKQELTFVEIPVILKYKISQKMKSRTNVHLSLAPQFLKGISGQLPNAQFLDMREQLSTENFRSFSMNLELGFNYSMRISEMLHFNITPYYSRNSGLKQVESFYSTRFNYLGIRSGIYIKL